MEDGSTRHRTTNRTGPGEPEAELEQLVERQGESVRPTWGLERHVSTEDGYADVATQQYIRLLVRWRWARPPASNNTDDDPVESWRRRGD